MFLQTATGKQLSILRHITGVWQREGLKSLFAGNGANCIRVLPFSALVCVAYSNMAKVCKYKVLPHTCRMYVTLTLLLNLSYTKFDYIGSYWFEAGYI